MTELEYLIIFIPVLPLKHKQKHSKLSNPKSDKNYIFMAFLIFFLGSLKSQIVNNSVNVNKVKCFTDGGMENRNYFYEFDTKIGIVHSMENVEQNQSN